MASKSNNQQQAPLVISYLRFSHPTQATGDSIRRQTEMSEQWANKRGWRIDDTLTDAGVSAFRGKNTEIGRLAEFLRLVEEQRIPRGSYLLIEALDRLSRNEVRKALILLLQLLEAGITVVTVGDNEREYSPDTSDEFDIMYSLIVLSRGHEESARKSVRVRAAWDNKFAKARQGGRKPLLTRQLPGWLRVNDDRIVVDPKRRAIVRRIYKYAMEGHGLVYICRQLNKDRVPLFAHGKRYWRPGYVTKLLRSRTVLGEMQPHRITKVDGGNYKRLPHGDPIPDYYPRIVTDEEFYAVQAQLGTRRRDTGPRTKFVNLWRGLIFDAGDGSALLMTTKRATRNSLFDKRYVSSAAVNGVPGHSPYVALSVAAFDAAMVTRLAEYHPMSSNGDESCRELDRQIGAIRGRILDVEKRMHEVHDLMASDPDASLKTLAVVLGKLEVERQQLQQREAELLRNRHQSLVGTWDAYSGEMWTLLGNLLECENDGAARTRVKHLAQKIVKRLDVGLTRPHNRLVEAKVHVQLNIGEKFDFTLTTDNIDVVWWVGRDGNPCEVYFGPKAEPDPVREQAKALRGQGQTYKQIGEVLKISMPTVYRYVKDVRQRKRSTDSV